MHFYSDFWLTGAHLTLDWTQDVPAEVGDAPFPTPVELEQYARLSLDARQAVELALGGEIISVQPDAHDRRTAQRQARRAKSRQNVGNESALLHLHA